MEFKGKRVRLQDSYGNNGSFRSNLLTNIYGRKDKKNNILNAIIEIKENILYFLVKDIDRQILNLILKV